MILSDGLIVAGETACVPEGTRPTRCNKTGSRDQLVSRTLKGRLKSIAAFQTAFGTIKAHPTAFAPLPYSNSAKPRKIRPKSLNNTPFKKATPPGCFFEWGISRQCTLPVFIYRTPK